MDEPLDLLLVDDQERHGLLAAGITYLRKTLRLKSADGIPPRLALPLLSAHAKHAGHSVEAVFGPLQPWNRKRFRALLARKPRVVGLSTVALFHTESVVPIVEEIRAASPSSLIVLGGHGSQDYAETRALGDLTITLHGEGILARLLDELKAGKTLDEVGGVTRGPDGARMLAGAVRYEGIEPGLYPDWSIARDGYGRYPIEASRGCVYNCVFCDFPGKKEQDFRTPEHVAGEMAHVIAETGVRRFDFVDATFTSEPDFIYGLCSEIKARGLDVDWHCFTRPDAYHRHPDLAEKMAQAGCTWVFMGVESIHDPILAAMRRGMTRRVIESGLARVFATSIKVHGNFIIGFPGETPETVKETAAFIRRYPFNDVGMCTLGTTPEILEAAARSPLRYTNLKGSDTAVKAWRHDTADYRTAYGWTIWAVREINRGHFKPIAYCPGNNHPDERPL